MLFLLVVPVEHQISACVNITEMYPPPLSTPSFFPQDINTVGQSDADPPALISAGMYQLDIVLKKGINLAIRDRGGRPWFSHGSLFPQEAKNDFLYVISFHFFFI